ncbi:glycoside hydrolase family 3 N-terminal domain-containing protein [Clostridium hydrogeniformans]|uniref:glycoside hydrolase family 3 N-terminal domain-containing protein n=1 Tax=Clostridium hydrogeniformans TaxID=349933 RepID=UPI0006896FE7|nr:glycoside hydrolase family 3 protein [Clostridium hydrogeniformans]
MKFIKSNYYLYIGIIILLVSSILLLVFSKEISISLNKKDKNSSLNISSKTLDDEITDLIKSTPLEKKLSQIMMISIENFNSSPLVSLNNEVKDFLINYEFGGFILFKNNISTKDNTINLISSIKKTSNIPMFIGCDEEGGRVSRINLFKAIPSAKLLGETRDPSLVYSTGKALGENLKSLGINVDFAPVLDINTNPKNPVIGDRAFGNTKEMVSTYGIEFMKGLLDSGIISCVKHFPGHGDTYLDSHKALPKVYKNIDNLKSLEIYPFKKAIENNVPMIMVAHIALPNIGHCSAPASLCSFVIQDILRKDLNYNGVVVSDALNMGAITSNYSALEASKLAIESGNDILLMPFNISSSKDIEEFQKYFLDLLNIIKNNKVLEENIDLSLKRILSLKSKLN